MEIVRDSNSANCFSELNISPLGRTPTGIACLRAQTSKLEKKEFESTTHFLRFTWIYSFLFLSHYFISLSEKKALFQYQDHFRERYCYNVLYFSTKSFSLISYDPLIDLEVVPSRRPSCSVVGSHRLAYKTVAIFWVSLQKGALQVAPPPLLHQGFHRHHHQSTQDASFHHLLYSQFKLHPSFTPSYLKTSGNWKLCFHCKMFKDTHHNVITSSNSLDN